ncbi:MAG: hypothetical protein JSS10_07680 [Verrucomicrobia bacterium]|nr:hypothetical protein [Verrucomicrobiota bacterium]
MSTEARLETLDRQFFEIAAHNLNPDQKQFLATKWKQIRHYACQNAGVKKWGSHVLDLNAEATEQLKEAFRTLVKGIEMIGFQIWKPTAKDPHLEAIFRLFFDDRTNLHDVDFSIEEKLALFWKYDATLITQFRERFEQIFRDLYHQMIWTQHDPLVTEMLIGNLIALYPLFDPMPEGEVDILQQIEGSWNLVRYRTEPIPLVEDKVLAYGLTPVSNPKALPLILFCGTPYPAAKGFWEAIKSDLHPFRSVGESIFLEGRERIDAWMNKKPQVKCYGLSLGGALAYHLGRTYGSRVTVFAYVPPGLFLKPQEMHKIHGVAFYHVDDFVPSLGYHPTGKNFTCYGVITEANRNFLLAHARPVGCNPTVVIEINPLHENRNVFRSLFTLGKHIFSALLFIATLPLRLAIDGTDWMRRKLKRKR